MPKHEDQRVIEEMTLEELIVAIPEALYAFDANYKLATKIGKARARKASLNLEKLMKRYRKVTV